MLMPTAEVEVPTDLVRRLLAAQHLPTRHGGTGRLLGFLIHRSSQPNHVIWRLNNSDAALKC